MGLGTDKVIMMDSPVSFDGIEPVNLPVTVALPNGALGEEQPDISIAQLKINKEIIFPILLYIYKT
jgi:hypothetical protein